jgi:CubicO group peptidase (beta-lactamase class C family)
MVFRLGSITKQFTATAILMLAEEGKVSLQDPIEKHLPGYPTQGHTITIEHLLTHTSGIQSYRHAGLMTSGS